jgi:hypothetical protein
MAIFTVHAPPGDLAEAIAADRVVLVREGFSWWALVVPFLWAPIRRLWLVLAGWIVATIGFELVDLFLDPTVALIGSAVFALWFAASARDFERRTLARRGLPMIGVVEATDREAAHHRLAAEVLSGRVRPTDARPPTGRRDTPIVPTGPAPIVGFPVPLGGRP